MDMRISAAVAALCLASLLARAQVTLEAIMSAPFVSELTASPSGRRLAWVENSSGVRNIWVAEGPGFKARRLTNYSEDDGQAIGNVQWTPDSGTIVYVRGGSENRSGENPNPLSSPTGAEQAIWLVPFIGGEPRRLDDGTAPAVAPNDGRVVYLKKGQIWMAVTGGNPAPARLFTARGECSAPRWSPDGTRLAFVSNRADHSFIGLYDLESKSLRYLDPSVDLDSEPVWSPDGTRIAFLRIPNSRVLRVFGPKREAEPWSIRVAEAATGAAREVWKASPGRGSVFHEVASVSQLIWAAGDRLIFPWEGDGWTHLYTVAAGGGHPLPLTPGDGEVENAALCPQTGDLYFSSNQGDMDRRHLWLVPSSGGKPVQLTSGNGIEWAPAPLAVGGEVALLRSDARRPARVAVMAGRNLIDIPGGALLPDGFPEQVLAEPEAVVFMSRDGMMIHGQLFRPARLAVSGRQPAVVFLHGGPRRQMLLGWNPGEYYHNAYAFNQYLASRGYLVLSVNFRSGTGYGMEFREALKYGAAGASEFNDVLGAADFLRGRPDVDPSRIALWGGSYGGYLTAMGLARNSDLFAAGVDLHGVHDWRTETRLYLDNDSFEVQQAASRLAFESSPLSQTGSWRSAVLLIHGDDDRNVEFRQTVQMVEALRARKVELEQMVFPDEVHLFLAHSSWLQAFNAAARFLDSHLGGPR
jgi:dipeptidyl aminopeptidase/acylaminoacyl peptidase